MLNIFKTAWDEITEAWEDFAWWEKTLWVVFFVSLYLMVLVTVAIYQPKKEEK